MTANERIPEVQFALQRLRGWRVWLAVLLSFAAGSLVTAYLTHPRQARADSDRVFELFVYHTAPGKAGELETIFRDVARLQANYDVHVVGYWVPNADHWADRFVYLVAAPSREELQKNTTALHADPAFPELRRRAAEIIERVNGTYNVDEVFMRPTDYSATK